MFEHFSFQNILSINPCCLLTLLHCKIVLNVTFISFLAHFPSVTLKIICLHWNKGQIYLSVTSSWNNSRKKRTKHCRFALLLTARIIAIHMTFELMYFPTMRAKRYVEKIDAYDESGLRFTIHWTYLGNTYELSLGLSLIFVFFYTLYQLRIFHTFLIK